MLPGMKSFDRLDANTWSDDNLPDGYEWREFNAELDQWHLYGPDGTDLTTEYHLHQGFYE
jgi:hypothetical protein